MHGPSFESGHPPWFRALESCIIANLAARRYLSRRSDGRHIGSPFMHKLCLFSLVVLGLSLSGCGPVYELRDQYTPPVDPVGQRCVRECESLRSGCSGECKLTFSRCTQGADEEAKEAYSRALEVYAAKLETYSAEKSLYDRTYAEYRDAKAELDGAYERAKQHCRQHDIQACAEKDRIDDRRDHLSDDYYGTGRPLHHEPKVPEKPSLEDETRRFRALRCDAECGCEKSFKACYIGCGGQVETKRYCIENCDE